MFGVDFLFFLVGVVSPPPPVFKEESTSLKHLLSLL